MWYKLIELANWFGEMKERYQLIRDFNKAGKHAFITGIAPTLIEAKISRGDSSYRHEFSKLFGGGFRIKALSGKALNRREMIELGRVILDNKSLVRKLVALGWDTLEVHDDTGYNGCKWPLKDYANLGGYLN
jgi:hypothetical protein